MSENLKCLDCGAELSRRENKSGRQKVRCGPCQKIHRRDYLRAKQRERRVLERANARD